MGKHLEELKVYYKEQQARYDRYVEFVNSPKFMNLYFEQKSLFREEVELLKKQLQIIKKRIKLDEQIERETNYIP